MGSRRMSCVRLTSSTEPSQDSWAIPKYVSYSATLTQLAEDAPEEVLPVPFARDTLETWSITSPQDLSDVPIQICLEIAKVRLAGLSASLRHPIARNSISKRISVCCKRRSGGTQCVCTAGKLTAVTGEQAQQLERV